MWLGRRNITIQLDKKFYQILKKHKSEEFNKGFLCKGIINFNLLKNDIKNAKNGMNLLMNIKNICSTHQLKVVTDFT